MFVVAKICVNNFPLKVIPLNWILNSESVKINDQCVSYYSNKLSDAPIFEKRLYEKNNLLSTAALYKIIIVQTCGKLNFK